MISDIPWLLNSSLYISMGEAFSDKTMNWEKKERKKNEVGVLT